MKIATITGVINPLMPVLQKGFPQQTEKVSEVHDDLKARIVYLEEDEVFIIISLDLLGTSLEEQLDLEAQVQKNYRKKVHLTICCTHTHFGADPEDPEYRRFLFATLYDLIAQLKPIQVETPKYNFRYVFYDEVGKSRISKQETPHHYLEVVSIYDDEKRLVNFVIYNCHPTIMSGYTRFFSAEYPGYLLKKLLEAHPDEFFTFLQGAPGDISTRFTRKSQEYSEVKRLATLLYHKTEELLKDDTRKEDLDLSYSGEYLQINHELIDLDTLEIPEDVSERELETINEGKEMRIALADRLDTLLKHSLISSYHFGTYRMVFAPNELFSFYIGAIDKEHSSLVCYANGYMTYVTPIGKQRITYELFLETFSPGTKQRLFDLLHHLSTE
jgi:hypothetical protein